MSYVEPTIVVTSAARTATGNSGSIDPAEMGETINLLANVTAVSGTTPSMTLSVEWSNDGTNFAVNDVASDAFTAITAAAVRVRQFERKALYYRIVWTISGTTPSFTFTVSEFVTQ